MIYGYFNPVLRLAGLAGLVEKALLVCETKSQ
jgi:hypothetical protein